MVAAVVATGPGCGTARPSAETPVATSAPPPGPLTAPQIEALLPEHTREGRAWSEAILGGLVANGLTVERTSACAVIAILGQESGFQEDPVVPGLAKLVRARIDKYKSKLGPLGDPLFERLLAGHAPNDARSFEQRLGAVRTERDVDILFRDLLSYYETNHPALFEAARWVGKAVDLDDLAELNPITTAGSMQVSVRFAEQWARERPGQAVAGGSVRDALYTRAGGVYFGAARLLAWPARYDQMLYRFADYNAGFYSSRNAAVQSQVAQLTGLKLALDGDLLAYEKNGEPRDEPSASARAVQAFAQKHAPRLSARAIERDLREEKTLAFEDTETYRAIKAAAERRTGGAAAYAMLPDVALNSPKITRPLSTAWFARAVDKKFQACMAR